jgi:hypothetical protein
VLSSLSHLHPDHLRQSLRMSGSTHPALIPLGHSCHSHRSSLHTCRTHLGQKRSHLDRRMTHHHSSRSLLHLGILLPCIRVP